MPVAREDADERDHLEAEVHEGPANAGERQHSTRGNFTLPTSEAFDVIDTVDVIKLDEISVHTRSPHSTQIAKRSKPARRIANTAV